MSATWKYTKIKSKLLAKKLARNQERDTEVNNYYKNNGWSILRIWEHELKQDFDDTIEKIATFIDKSKQVELS